VIRFKNYLLSKRRPVLVYLRVLLVGIFFGYAPQIVACDSCTITSLKRDYKRASIVVRAELIDEKDSLARLRVLERWKGPVEEELLVSLSGGASCRFRGFAAGTEYLVFVYVADKELVVSDCSHTNPITAESVRRQVATIRTRHGWWNSCLSFSLPWNR
jgi:hypothetical protein